MRPSQKHINLSILSSIFMMLTLAWLTVSLPVVYAAQTISAEKTANTTSPEQNDEDNSNPFANTTEEKAPTNVNLSEEYLHDMASSEKYTIVPSTEYKVEHVSTYVAFHGELISPPPDFS